MNWTLIKKDLRLMRPVTIGAIILAIVFYVTLPTTAVFEIFKSLEHPSYGNMGFWQKLYQSRDNVMAALSTACVVVNGCLLLWGAVLGGMSFALERRERWGDLLGTLPLTRERWINTKFASSLLWASGYLLINVVIYSLNNQFRVTIHWYGYTPQITPGRWEGVEVKDFVQATLSESSYALGLFGIAWVMSSIIRSAAIAACVPLGVVLVSSIMAGLFFTDSKAWYRSVSPDVWDVIFKFVLPLTVAAITIPIGIAVQRMRSTA